MDVAIERPLVPAVASALALEAVAAAAVAASALPAGGFGERLGLISGFTHLVNAFTTPFRAINDRTRNSRRNDPHHTFDHTDFPWRRRHDNTPRQHPCTRLIVADQVNATFARILGFSPPTGRETATGSKT